MAPTFEALLVPAAYHGDFARLTLIVAPGLSCLLHDPRRAQSGLSARQAHLAGDPGRAGRAGDRSCAVALHRRLGEHRRPGAGECDQPRRRLPIAGAMALRAPATRRACATSRRLSRRPWSWPSPYARSTRFIRPRSRRLSPWSAAAGFTARSCWRSTSRACALWRARACATGARAGRQRHESRRSTPGSSRFRSAASNASRWRSPSVSMARRRSGRPGARRRQRSSVGAVRAAP